MKLSELFELLASGELANLFMGDGGLGVLKPTHQKVLLNSINLGLVDLHTRFLLKRETFGYVIRGNIITITRTNFIELLSLVCDDYTLISNKDYYQRYVNSVILNDFAKFKDKTVQITYKAKPNTLTQTDIDKDSVIDLPDSYLNALCLFVASRLYTSLNNQLDGDLNEGTRYMQRYLAEIEMLTNQGIDVDNLNDMWLFHQRGFI